MVSILHFASRMWAGEPEGIGVWLLHSADEIVSVLPWRRYCSTHISNWRIDAVSDYLLRRGHASASK